MTSRCWSAWPSKAKTKRPSTEAVVEADELEAKLVDLEFRRMFSGQHDGSDCYIDIQSGSGGTEAQDWANMVLRMYLRWGDAHGYKPELIECSEGDVAGIKSATIKFTGEYAFGWLRTETGVHRLVRKSPFDSGGRRHTSFCSVFVYPGSMMTSGSRSTRLIFASTSTAPPVPVVSTSTGPSPRCVSPTCRPAWWCSARTTVPSTRTKISV